MNGLYNQPQIEKKPYIHPFLVILGEVEEGTKASGCGKTLDANFSAGDNFDDITCYPTSG